VSGGGTDEAADLLAGGLGEVVCLADEGGGLLGQTAFELLDGGVELRLEGIEALVELGHLRLDGGDHLVDLGAAGAEAVGQALDELATADLRLLHGKHTEADGDVCGVADSGDQLLVEVGKLAGA